MHSNLSLGSPGIKDIISFKSNSEPSLVIKEQAFFHEVEIACSAYTASYLVSIYYFSYSPSSHISHIQYYQKGHYHVQGGPTNKRIWFHYWKQVGIWRAKND